MTKEELLDLLRDARVSVVRDKNYAQRERLYTYAEKLNILRERIDAALAERQDKPPCSCGQPYPCMKGCPDCCHSQGYLDYCQGDRHAEAQDSATDVVEWKQRQGCYIHDDGVNELRVHLWGDLWHWSTVVEYRANGTCATEAEAKSAAIAVARGMR
jgi:hypothetical protein